MRAPNASEHLAFAILCKEVARPPSCFRKRMMRDLLCHDLATLCLLAVFSNFLCLVPQPHPPIRRDGLPGRPQASLRSVRGTFDWNLCSAVRCTSAFTATFDYQHPWYEVICINMALRYVKPWRVYQSWCILCSVKHLAFAILCKEVARPPCRGLGTLCLLAVFNNFLCSLNAFDD